MDVNELLEKAIGKKVRIILRNKKNEIIDDYTFNNFQGGFVNEFSKYNYFHAFISCLTHTIIIELKEK